MSPITINDTQIGKVTTSTKEFTLYDLDEQVIGSAQCDKLIVAEG